MEPFITSPIFAVAKKQHGPPKRDARGRLKYRQAHHLSRRDSHHMSVNEMSADISAEIKYETVQSAVNHIFSIAKSTINPVSPSKNPSPMREAHEEVPGDKAVEAAAVASKFKFCRFD